MKKSFFYVALAAVALTSCSKHDDDVVVNNNNNNTEDKQAIQFVMGSPVEITTRGTGAVGDVEGGENYWAGETLNVYMFNQGTLELAQNGADEPIGTDENGNDVYPPFFENAEITAPVNGTNMGWANYGTTKYYPGNGNFDFFAYRADDAIAEGDAPTKNGNAYEVMVTINGTQDLMTAKAKMTEEQKAEYIQKETEKNEAAAEKGEEGKGDIECKRIYSAYAARRGVQPHFQFKHELVRFVFYAVDAEDGVDSVNVETGNYHGITIDKVEILNAKIKANMTVASLEDNLGVVPTEETGVLALMQRSDRNMPAEELIPVQFDQTNDTVRLGESMMLFPSESYELKVSYSQKPDGVTNVNSFYPHTLKLKNGGMFEAGTQYNVYFKVYNTQKIELELELTAWQEGEDIPVDSEDEIQ